MTQITGQVVNYALHIYAPNAPYSYKSVITLHGTFGLAVLYFEPEGGTLGTNRKRDKFDTWDFYFRMSSWPHIVDLLRNEKPVNFFFEDTTKVVEIVTASAEPVGEAESP